MCVCIPCSFASPAIVLILDQRKNLETATDSYNNLLDRESYQPEAKGPGATSHPAWPTVSRMWWQSLLL